jgi:hypothetical protein
MVEYTPNDRFYIVEDVPTTDMIQEDRLEFLRSGGKVP